MNFQARSLFFGVIVGSAAGVFFSEFGINFLIESIKQNIIQIGVFIVLLLTILFIIYLFHEKLIYHLIGTNKTKASDLPKDIFTIINISPKYSLDDKENATYRTVSTLKEIYLKFRFNVAAYHALTFLIMAGIGIFSTYILLRQNEIIENQTALLDSQGKVAEIQALQNIANQRAVYQPEISRFILELTKLSFDDESEETVDPKNPFDGQMRILTPGLEAELRRLLSLLEPYEIVLTRSADDPAYTGPQERFYTVKASPEKGQLLEALLTNKIDLSTEIVTSLDFTYARMRGKEISFQEQGADFDINCSTSAQNYDEQEISWTSHLYDLSGLDLTNADFTGSYFDFVNINASGVILNDAEFVNSNLIVDQLNSKNTKYLKLSRTSMTTEKNYGEFRNLFNLEGIIFDHNIVSCMIISDQNSKFSFDGSTFEFTDKTEFFDHKNFNIHSDLEKSKKFIHEKLGLMPFNVKSYPVGIFNIFDEDIIEVKFPTSD